MRDLLIRGVIPAPMPELAALGPVTSTKGEMNISPQEEIGLGSGGIIHRARDGATTTRGFPIVSRQLQGGLLRQDPDHSKSP
jgi:hypothetical protein